MPPMPRDRSSPERCCWRKRSCKGGDVLVDEPARRCGRKDNCAGPTPFRHLFALHTLRADRNCNASKGAAESREACGVRPACRRFRAGFAHFDSPEIFGASPYASRNPSGFGKFSLRPLHFRKGEGDRYWWAGFQGCACFASLALIPSPKLFTAERRGLLLILGRIFVSHSSMPTALHRRSRRGVLCLEVRRRFVTPDR